jgi:hypothetical protein
MQVATEAGSAKLVSWAQSPDGVSLIQVWSATRGGRPIHMVRRANLAGEVVATIAMRVTEEQASKRANLVWLCDKYGDAEGNKRYLTKYR